MSEDPEELKEDKGGEEGGGRRDGQTWGKAAFSDTHPCLGLRSLCPGPEAREAWLTGV